MATLTLRILGCGSSGGVPRVGSGWGACDPNEPRNRRRRCSILVERDGGGGRTSLLVDTSPDLREQLLDAGVERLDGVLFTPRPCRPYPRDRRPAAPGDQDAGRSGLCRCPHPGPAHRPLRLLLRATPRGATTRRSSTCTISRTGEGDRERAGGRHRGRAAARGARQRAGAGLPLRGRRLRAGCEPRPPGQLERLRGLDLLIIDALRDTPHPTHYAVSDALASSPR